MEVFAFDSLTFELRAFMLRKRLPRWHWGKEPDAGDGVQSLDQEDPLKECMATHSSILA